MLNPDQLKEGDKVNAFVGNYPVSLLYVGLHISKAKQVFLFRPFLDPELCLRFSRDQVSDFSLMPLVG